MSSPPPRLARNRTWGTCGPRQAAAVILRFIDGSVAEHGEDDVAASAGEDDEGLVVVLHLGAFAVMVDPGERVCQGSECVEEHIEALRWFEVPAA